MELKIICKRLITEDLNGRLTEGESGADVVGITVPRYYGELDLSLFSFRMTSVAKDGKAAAEQLLTRDKCGEDSIHLLWTVTSDFTALDGETVLTLAGVGPDGEVIKFSSEPVNIENDGRVEFVPTPALSEQLFDQVQLEAQKALSAAERAEKAAESHSIKAATEEALGGVLSGGDITVSETGSVTVNSVGGKTVGTDVPENAVFTDTVYTLPTASKTTLGGVKIDGKTVVMDGDGVISAAEEYTLPAASAKALGGVKSGGDITVSETGGVTVNSVNGKTVGANVPSNAKFTDTVYKLPSATASSLGGVMVDGTTITTNSRGVISVIGARDPDGEIILPKATEDALGAVRVDGTTITADADGIISASAKPYTLPAASADAIGGIKSGGDIAVSESGEVTVNSVNGKTVGTDVPENAVFTDTVYTLPTAAEETLGGVKSGGDISVSESGGVTVNSVNGKTVGTDVPENAVFTDTVYDLPAAAEETLGGIKSGGDISVSESGGVTVNSVNGKTVGTDVPENAVFTDTVYTLPTATEEAPGGIKSGGDIAVSESGEVTVNSVGGKTVGTNVPENAVFTDTVYTLPKATTSVIGGVRPDGNTINVDANGIISLAKLSAKMLGSFSKSYNATSATLSLTESWKPYKFLAIRILAYGSDNYSICGLPFFFVRTSDITIGPNYKHILGAVNELSKSISITFYSDYRQIIVTGYTYKIEVWGFKELF